jgi:hypothetical protein
LSKARREALPLKVRAPEWAPKPREDLDPTLPAKKRLRFEDLAHITATAMEKLPRGEAVKKKVTAFLLQDPPLLATPPGLSDLPW